MTSVSLFPEIDSVSRHSLIGFLLAVVGGVNVAAGEEPVLRSSTVRPCK
jgi:hypothetical protein